MGLSGSKDAEPAEPAGPFGHAELNELRQQWARCEEGGFDGVFGLPGTPSFAHRLADKFGRWDHFPSTAGTPPAPPAPGAPPPAVTFDQFVNGVASCTRAPSAVTLRVLWDVALPAGAADAADQPRSATDLEHLFTVVFLLVETVCTARASLAPAEAGSAQSVEGVVEAAVNITTHDARRMATAVVHYGRRNHACSGPDGPVDFDLFAEWCAQYAALLHLALAGFVQRRCLPGRAPPSSARPLCLPALDKPSSILHKTPGRAAAELLPLWVHSSELQGQWRRVFTSAEDGMSFNRLVHAINGYGGPSLLLLQDDSGEVFGGFAASGWRVANEFAGSSGCFLFKLAPSVGIYRSRIGSGAGGNFMWLNDKGFSLPHGLGFGGDVGHFRLFIPEGLEGCSTENACLSFEAGKLRSGAGDEMGADAEFDLRAIEVWGCGGEEALAQAAVAQAQSRAAADHAINKARKVDKAAFLGNEFDREMLLGKTFGGGSAQADRRMGNS